MNKPLATPIDGLPVTGPAPGLPSWEQLQKQLQELRAQLEYLRLMLKLGALQ